MGSKNRHGHTSAGVVAGMVVGVAFSLALGVYANKEAPDSPIPYEDIRAFSDIFSKIKSDYVDPVPDKDLMQGAINGMVESLDPHSTYLTPDHFKEMQIATDGKFGGLGIEVTMERGVVKVVAPIDDTPAVRAGIQAGDYIFKLDGKPVKGMTLQDAVNVMRGKPGTDIKLTIFREGVKKPVEVVITRDIIHVRSVKSSMLEPGYGYIRVAQFQQQTGRDLRRALTKLMSENDGDLKGLVLDLRNNPGGVLSGAVEVADTFLSEGLVVYTRGRIADSALEFSAGPPDFSHNTPVVVLINSGSASASEIVAGALQDNGRAKVVGTRSFGKGSVQTILPMRNGAALKLTTALYYTPGGNSIQASGIVPDVEIDPLAEKQEDNEPWFLREVDLTGHLDNPNGKEVEKKTKTSPLRIMPSEHDLEIAKKLRDGELDQGKQRRESPDLERDFQLREAVKVLKGTAVYEKVADKS